MGIKDEFRKPAENKGTPFTGDQAEEPLINLRENMVEIWKMISLNLVEDLLFFSIFELKLINYAGLELR